MKLKLNSEQQDALEVLRTRENIFLTGAAGSGKSTLLREYLHELNSAAKASQRVPILASTGAAAILVGGRTFHSFFGLGIMEGGEFKTIERALKNFKLKERLRATDTVVIDEISMISGTLLRTAEAIARRARENSSPWGGMRVIAVGDFAQLPPVDVHSARGAGKDWAFLDEAWEQSCFQSVVLNTVMRTEDEVFLRVLNDVREGRVSAEVREFLDYRAQERARALRAAGRLMEDVTYLFPRRDAAERTNLERLEQIDSPARVFETVFTGRSKDVESFRKHSPLGDRIALKEGALVMLRQNDVDGAYVNGSLGHVVDISEDGDLLRIELLAGKKRIDLEPAEFTLLNADGEAVVTARNFPVSLAWAMTIHKAQGATLDRVCVDLRQAWEPGQAYVALSRARSPYGLFVEGWQPRSILADPLVAAFHAGL